MITFPHLYAFFVTALWNIIDHLSFDVSLLCAFGTILVKFLVSLTFFKLSWKHEPLGFLRPKFTFHGIYSCLQFFGRFYRRGKRIFSIFVPFLLFPLSLKLIICSYFDCLQLKIHKEAPLARWSRLLGDLLTFSLHLPVWRRTPLLRAHIHIISCSEECGFWQCTDTISIC